MRYYIIAGEASGDLHGSNLMKELYKQDKEAVIRFCGGGMMESVSDEMSSHKAPDEGMFHDYRNTAVMGYIDVVANIKTILESMDDCKYDIIDFHPDVVILIDYPGFNLKIARWAYNYGFKVFYYIAPKVWASREYRNAQLKKYVDRLFIVFPFEKDYFTKKEIPFFYCGNPLIDAIKNSGVMSKDRKDFLAESKLPEVTRYVALLAGSRNREIATMMPIFNETIRLLHAEPEFKDLRFIIAGAPGHDAYDYGNIDKRTTRLIFGKTQEILHFADAAVINSGTASLEAVLLNTPQLVVYKLKSKLEYCIGKIIVKGKFISLGNLCADRLVFKEFYRPDNTNAQAVSEELKRLLKDVKYRNEMLEGYKGIRNLLGGEGASERAAAEMIRLLND